MAQADSAITNKNKIGFFTVVPLSFEWKTAARFLLAAGEFSTVRGRRSVYKEENFYCDPAQTIFPNPEINYPEDAIKSKILKIKLQIWLIFWAKILGGFLACLIGSYLLILTLPIWLIYGKIRLNFLTRDFIKKSN